MKHGRRRRLAVVSGSVLLALVILLAVAWSSGLLLHDSGEAASLQEALDEFRAGAGSAGEGRAGEGGGSEIEGVYLYATEGRESVDALGGAVHAYPATTAITVTRARCGLQLRWAALKGRSTAWTFCSSAAGIELRRSDERHSFFGRVDHTVYGCSGRLLLPRSREPKEFPFRCRSGRALQTGVTRILERAVVEVGGEKIGAVRARTSLEIEGEDDGRETIDWWLDAKTALPLRISLRSRTSRPLFVGRVHYSEDFSLRLLSTRPRR